MKKHQYHLPAGCHDANTAAELLGLSKRKLLKRMRELGWLIVGGDAHNLPRREFMQRGWMASQDRGYALKGNREITKTYKVMLLTQAGFQELKKIMESGKTAAQTENATAKTNHQQQPPAPPRELTPEERAASDAEREKALAQLREWGLTG